MIRCQSWCLLYNSDSRIFCTVKTSFILTVICCLQQLSVLVIFCINMSSILPFCSLKLLFVFVCGIQLIDLISAANTEQYRCQCWMVGKYGHSHWLLGIQVSGVRCVRFTTWRWQCSPTVCWRFVFCAATDDTVDRWWDTEIRGLFLSAATGGQRDVCGCPSMVLSNLLIKKIKMFIATLFIAPLHFGQGERSGSWCNNASSTVTLPHNGPIYFKYRQECSSSMGGCACLALQICFYLDHSLS